MMTGRAKKIYGTKTELAKLSFQPENLCREMSAEMVICSSCSEWNIICIFNSSNNLSTLRDKIWIQKLFLLSKYFIKTLTLCLMNLVSEYSFPMNIRATKVDGNLMTNNFRYHLICKDLQLGIPVTFFRNFSNRNCFSST